MLTWILLLLAVFYAGAVCATARGWYCAWRGAVGFSVLRDLTGISDRALLRRLFGLTRADGSYRAGIADILRHRRLAGLILADLPLHAGFLAALGVALALGSGPVATAIAVAAAAHMLLVALAALSVLVAGRQPLAG